MIDHAPLVTANAPIGRCQSKQPIMIILAAMLTLSLIAACSSGNSDNPDVASIRPTTGTSSTASSSPSPGVRSHGDGVAYAQCMRSHGVSKFPDPGSNGVIPKLSMQQLGVTNSQFQSAETACRGLLPDAGSGPSATQMQQNKAQALRFSNCIRSQGVPDFPDPDSSGRIPDPASVGIGQGSPKFQQANHTCARFRPPYFPSNAEYNSWRSSHGGS